jgi:PKD repeat protein
VRGQGQRANESIPKVLREIRSRSGPRTRILVLDYPPIFPSSWSGTCELIRSSDVAALHSLEERFDDFLLQEIAKAAVGAEPVELRAPSWTGRDLCEQAGSWFNHIPFTSLFANLASDVTKPFSPTFGEPGASLSAAKIQSNLRYAVHPNGDGQREMAKAVIAQLANPLVGSLLDLRQGQTLTSHQAVTAGSQTLAVGASWPGSKVTMALTSPDGSVIDAAHMSPEAQRSVTPTSEQLVVEHPEAGEWTIAVTGVEMAPQGEPVRLVQSTIEPPPAAPPIAVFTQSALYGASSRAPLSVEFDASASSDVGGRITSYRWQFGDGTTAEGPTLTHVFTRQGTYEVTLTVTDSGGATSTYTGSPMVVTAVGTEGEGAGGKESSNTEASGSGKAGGSEGLGQSEHSSGNGPAPGGSGQAKLTSRTGEAKIGVLGTRSTKRANPRCKPVRVRLTHTRKRRIVRVCRKGKRKPLTKPTR